MSVKLMSQVWDNAPYKDGSLLILLALADFANDDGFCYPSHDRLAEKCRMTRRNVIYILDKFESDGILKIEKSRGRNNVNHYQLDFSKWSKNVKPASHFTDKENVKPISHFDGYNVKPISRFNNVENVKLETQNVKLDAIKCETHFTQTIIEPSIEPSERERDAPANLTERSKQDFYISKLLEYRRRSLNVNILPNMAAEHSACETLFLNGFSADQAITQFEKLKNWKERRAPVTWQMVSNTIADAQRDSVVVKQKATERPKFNF